jgi:hypothetical protein
VIKCEIGCVLFEPRGDAAEFVGEFSVKWGKWYFARKEAIGGPGRKAKAWQFAFAPCRLQAAVVKSDAAKWSQVNVNVSGSAELVELALTVDGAS